MLLNEQGQKDKKELITGITGEGKMPRPDTFYFTDKGCLKNLVFQHTVKSDPQKVSWL
jgi:hypothetical protein